MATIFTACGIGLNIFSHPFLYRAKKYVWKKLFGSHFVGRFEVFLPTRKSILDIGCGLGDITVTMKDHRQNFVVGTDTSKRLLKYANKHNQVDGYVLGDANKLPFMNDAFDLVTLLDVLHHTLKPEEIVREAKRVSNRYLVVAEIGIFENRIIRPIESLWLKITDGGSSYLPRRRWKAIVGTKIVKEERYGALKRACLLVAESKASIQESHRELA